MQQIWAGNVTAILALFAIGCGTDADPDVETKESELTFGTRIVDQVVGEFDRAHWLSSPTIYYVPDSHNAAQRALQSRSVARVVPWYGCAGTPEGYDDLRGSSGFLTSDSRLTTSIAALGGNAHLDQPARPMRIHFEGEVIGSSVSGINFKDDNVPFSGPEELTHRSTIGTAETPYLAQRLFSLGLRKWAESTPDGVAVRRQLRRWDFVPDIQDGSGFLGQSYATVSLNSESNPRFEGLDVAILRPENRVEPLYGDDPEGSNPFVYNLNNSQLPPGVGFAMNKPAVFFDYAPASKGPGEQRQEDFHSSSYVSIWGEFDHALVPLVASPAEYLGPLELLVLAARCGEAETDDASVYGGLYSAKTDVGPHAIGGAGQGIIPKDYPDAEFDWQWTRSIGVFSLEYTGRFRFPTTWEDGFIEEQSEEFNLFTSLVNVERHDWDEPGSGEGSSKDPRPLVHSSDQDPCADRDVDDNCILLNPTRDPINVCSHPSVCPDPDDGSDDYQPDEPVTGDGSDRDYLVACNYDANGQPWHAEGVDQKGGMLVGVIGAKATSQSGDHIGSIQGICAPYTKVPYTSNWRFLYTYGVRGRWDNARGPLGMASTTGRTKKALRQSLIDSFELRGDQVRPISMLMCPPNYGLAGLQVGLATDSGSETGYVMRGINAINCNKLSDGLFGEEVAGPLTMSLSAHAPAVYDFETDGAQYSLQQQIGDPNGSVMWETGCDTDEVARVLDISSQSNRITMLEIRCIDKP